MCLSELTKVSEMADLTRNNLLLTAEEVAALSLQFAHPSTAHSVEDGREQSLCFVIFQFQNMMSLFNPCCTYVSHVAQ